MKTSKEERRGNKKLMSLSGWSEFYWIRILSRYFSTVVRPVLFWALGLIQRMRLKGKITLWKTQDSKREKVNSWLKMTEKGLTQKSSQISSPDDWTIHIHEIFPPQQWLRVQSYDGDGSRCQRRSLDFRTTAMQNRTTTESNRVIVESLLL
jgi:hypothetical protein